MILQQQNKLFFPYARLHIAVGSMLDCRSRGHKFFVEIDHEIISKVIVPIPLIEEGHMSVTGKSMCTKYWLTTKRTKPALAGLGGSVRCE